MPLIAPIEGTPFIGGNPPGDLSIGATGLQHVIKANFSATAAPAVGNDSTQNYEIGSRWLDVTADKFYVCLDATAGAAVWRLATLAVGATTQIPYMNAGGTDLSYSSGLAFDGTTQIATNFATGAATVGSEKVTNPSFTGNDASWTKGGAGVWQWGYVITVSGITTAPGASGVSTGGNSVYSDGTTNYVIRYRATSGSAPTIAGTLWATGLAAPSASTGTLTRVASCDFNITGTSGGLPTVGDTYTNNTQTFTVIGPEGMSGTTGRLVCTQTGNSAASGTLTNASGAGPTTMTFSSRVIGTGDATIAYSAYVGDVELKCLVGTGTLSQSSAVMVTPLAAGEYYILSFTIPYIAAGGITVSCGAGTPTPLTITNITDTGVHTILIKAGSTADLVVTPTSTARFVISNLSLKKSDGNIVGKGSLILDGTFGAAGATPAYGSGSKLMWIAHKSAFRVGYATTAGEWNEDKIGTFSFGAGSGSLVFGSYSAGFGNSCAVYATSSLIGGSSCTTNKYADYSFNWGIANVLGTTTDTGSGYLCGVIGSGNTLLGQTQYGMGGGSILGLAATSSVFLGQVEMYGIYNSGIGNGIVINSDEGSVLGNRSTIGTGSTSGTIVGNDCSIGNDSPYTTLVGYYLVVPSSTTGYITNIGAVSTVSGPRASNVGIANWNEGEAGITLGTAVSILSGGLGSIVAGFNGFNDAGATGGSFYSSGIGSIVLGYVDGNGGIMSATGTGDVLLGKELNTTGNYTSLIGRQFTENTTDSFNLGWGSRQFQVTAAGVNVTVLPTGTLASPPGGLVSGDVWSDSTDSATDPILRIHV